MASLSGLALFALSTWGALWVLLIGTIYAQVPDRSAPDGDPCCAHPDTWGEVATGLGITLVLAMVVCIAFSVAAALIVRGIRGRWLRPRPLLLVPAAGAIVAATAMVLLLIVPG
jgi:hypothetical protein